MANYEEERTMAKKKAQLNSALFQMLNARLDGDADAKISDFTPEENKEVLIKSRERVKQFGEVYTPAWMVSDMCDMVPQLRLDDTTYSLEDKLNFTVLEPTCGNGNFLVELLRRKLHFAFSADEDDLVINLFKAVSSLQGIDIQRDNVIETRERMHDIIVSIYEEHYNSPIPAYLISALDKVLELDIIHGDTLHYIKYDEQGSESELMLNSWKIKRVDDNIIVTVYDYYLAEPDTDFNPRDVNITELSNFNKSIKAC